MLCNQSSRSFNNWSFCDRSIWFLLHLTWDYFDSSDWRICLLLVGRIYLFCWSIQYFYRIYLLWRRSACNIIDIILPVSITCNPANKPVLLHRSRSSELCCIPAIDHRTYFFKSSFASVILVLIVVLGSRSHNVFSTFLADLTTTFIASSEPPEIYFQPSCSSEHSHIIFSGTTISVYFMGL